jgi:hypothetical protein
VRTRHEDDETTLVNGCRGSLDAPDEAKEGGVPWQGRRRSWSNCHVRVLVTMTVRRTLQQ